MDKLYHGSFNPFKVYYDFYEDAWIGYIPASFLIDETNNESDLSQQVQIDKGDSTSPALIANIIETFIEKGVHHIETDFHESNSVFIEILEKYGYNLISSERLASRLQIDEVKLPKEYTDREKLEFEILSQGLYSRPSFIKLPYLHILEDEVIHFLVDKENISKSSLSSFFQYLRENPDKIISQVIFKRDAEIQGHVMVVRTRWNKNTGILSFLNMKHSNDQVVQDLLIAKCINDCKIQGIKLLEVYIRDDVLLKEKHYERYGFVFSNVHHFET